MLTKEDFALILRCTLFQWFTERSLSEVLNWLGAFERSYRSGEMVFLIGDPMRYAGILLKGTVSVSFLDESSNSVNMNLFFPGELFGESLACLEGNSPVQMKATSDCRILFLNLRAVTKAEAFPEGYQAVFVTNLLRDFARQNRFINRKLRIVSQKRLRDRILVYLREQETLPDGTARLPFNRGEWAQFMGVNRSALARELSRMEEDGVLKLDGRQIRLLDHSAHHL